MVIVESFNTINELVNTIGKRPHNSEMDGQNSSEESDYAFTKTRNYSEATNLLHYGFPEAIPKIKEKIRKCKYENKGDAKKAKQTNSIVGYVPNVPNALQGKIDSMINSERVIFKKKTLSVVYLMGANCDKDTNYFIEAGSALIAAIQSIEKTGVQVELKQCFFSAAGDSSHRVYSLLNIKNYGHRFDIRKITFPLAHPSMFRRIGFKWLETVPGLNSGTGFAWGYGHAINDPETEKVDLQDELGPNTIVINIYQIHQMENNVEKIIEYLKAK